MDTIVGRKIKYLRTGNGECYPNLASLGESTQVTEGDIWTIVDDNKPGGIVDGEMWHSDAEALLSNKPFDWQLVAVKPAHVAEKPEDTKAPDTKQHDAKKPDADAAQGDGKGKPGA